MVQELYIINLITKPKQDFFSFFQFEEPMFSLFTAYRIRVFFYKSQKDLFIPKLFLHVIEFFFFS